MKKKFLVALSSVFVSLNAASANDELKPCAGLSYKGAFNANFLYPMFEEVQLGLATSLGYGNNGLLATLGVMVNADYFFGPFDGGFFSVYSILNRDNGGKGIKGYYKGWGVTTGFNISSVRLGAFVEQASYDSRIQKSWSGGIVVSYYNQVNDYVDLGASIFMGWHKALKVIGGPNTPLLDMNGVDGDGGDNGNLIVHLDKLSSTTETERKEVAAFMEAVGYSSENKDVSVKEIIRTIKNYSKTQKEMVDKVVEILKASEDQSAKDFIAAVAEAQNAETLIQDHITKITSSLKNVLSNADLLKLFTKEAIASAYENDALDNSKIETAFNITFTVA